jgi:hypothetical protein
MKVASSSSALKIDNPMTDPHSQRKFSRVNGKLTVSHYANLTISPN